MLKICVKQGMIAHTANETFPLKQSKGLEKHRGFNIQKRNQAGNDFEKDFHNLLKNAFYGKTMEHVRNRMNILFFEKIMTKKFQKTMKTNFQWNS